VCEQFASPRHYAPLQEARSVFAVVALAPGREVVTQFMGQRGPTSVVAERFAGSINAGAHVVGAPKAALGPHTAAIEGSRHPCDPASPPEIAGPEFVRGVEHLGHMRRGGTFHGPAVPVLPLGAAGGEEEQGEGGGLHAQSLRGQGLGPQGGAGVHVGSGQKTGGC